MVVTLLINSVFHRLAVNGDTIVLFSVVLLPPLGSVVQGFRSYADKAITNDRFHGARLPAGSRNAYVHSCPSY